jgi:transcriptional regulator with XRE-family HTH domain
MTSSLSMSWAFRSELTLSQIARIETVKINPTVSSMFRIAKALDVEITELFDCFGTFDVDHFIH